MLRFILFAAVLLTCSFAIAKPARQSPPMPPPAKVEAVPQLAGSTTWGVMVQDGRRLTINGNNNWFGFGEIRRDGKVQLTWVQIEDNRQGIAVYLVEENGRLLSGIWGWSDEVELCDRHLLKVKPGVDESIEDAIDDTTILRLEE